ncbi:MAG: hypothetical protein ACT4OP_07150 [Actinomycetota bacterium]
MSLIVGLIALLLLITALLLWQHARREQPGEVTFGVEDAVAFVYSRLEGDTAQRLRMDGVRRVIEWDIYYLQGLAQENRRTPVETVAGPYGPAVEFISREIGRRQGHTYLESDIRAVLAHQVAYLQSIGAIGAEAGGLAE